MKHWKLIVIVGLVFCAVIIFLEPTQEDWNRSLLEAVLNGEISKTKKAITGGAAINTTNDKRESPLYVASREGHTEVVKILLAAGADTNLKSCSALTTAAGNGHTEIVKLLLAAGADADLCSGFFWCRTALFSAAQFGHTEIVKLLLEAGADVHKKSDLFDLDALFIASIRGHTGIVKLLKEYGAHY